MGQHAADQVSRSFADHALDCLPVDAREPEVMQHGIQRGLEVSQRIDQGTVEIDDGGSPIAMFGPSDVHTGIVPAKKGARSAPSLHCPLQRLSPEPPPWL